MKTTPPRKQDFYRKPRFWFVLIFLFFLVLVLTKCSFSNKKHPKPPLFVVSATAKTANVPVYIAALGTVTATYTVTVKTQVNGQLMQVLFKEGQQVKKDELIAQIDPRPFQAQLLQFQGQLERDQALLANARVDLKRYQKLWQQNSVAKQVLDTQVSLVQQDEGNVQVDQGQIAATKVNLIYCNITSPMDGRIGLRLVDPGNFVQTSDTTGIAVVNMLTPITAIFSIPEDVVPAVTQQTRAGQTLLVKAFDRQQTTLLGTGTLLTMDNQINTTTGTVNLKATFPNTNNALFPNQFVNIKLLVKTLKNAIVVPTAAIQQGNSGTFVYLINSDNTVSIKPVTVGVSDQDNSVIKTGLQSGQPVVIEGTDKLTDGAAITLTGDTDTTKTVAGKKQKRSTT